MTKIDTYSFEFGEKEGRKQAIEEELKFMKECDNIGGLICSNDFWSEKEKELKSKLKEIEK